MVPSRWSPDAVPGRIAPEAMAALAALGPAADRIRLTAGSADDTDIGLGAAVRRRVRTTLGLGAADPDPGESELTEGELADRDLAERFADQFVLDVASVTAAQREALNERFGASTFPLVQVMWVADFGTRADAALRQLFGSRGLDGLEVPAPGVGGEDGTGLWSAIDDFLVEVARLDQLDPVTTELVRLRGARAHNCRLCRSRRLVPAVQAGADEATFDQVDDYERSALPERHKVALRLTDAMVWSPGAWPSEVADQVRRAFAPDEAVELVLDVTRNSANKIAVALGADAAQVADGEIEYYDVRPDGQLVYGVALD
jgi:alkylhydroperoxidase family enzyme